MKLLIVEYINGGGFAGQNLPPALAAEGGLMLQALLDELKQLPDLTLVMPLDRRCCRLSVPDNCQIHWLNDDSQPLLPLLQSLIADCDAIWPIAPETDGILYAIAKMAENADKTLLLSNSATVALCTDKLATSQILRGAGIAAVETQVLRIPPKITSRNGISRQTVRAEQSRSMNGLARETSGFFRPSFDRLLATAPCVALPPASMQSRTNGKIFTIRNRKVICTDILNNEAPLSTTFPKVLKPNDGVGCEGSFVVADLHEYQQALARLVNAGPSTGSGQTGLNYVEQPFLHGDAISLSCLFKSGKAWLLSCNRQQINCEDGQFQLHGCLVNVENSRREYYQDLLGKIAAVIPGLWGYVGIDLIETPDRGPVILEINPRLTTSYAGVQPATGINVAEQVLRLLDGDAELPAAHRQSIQISIH